MGHDLVDRGTSDTLIAPDWVLNQEICNDINQNARLVQDVVKALKKRMGHKNPKVQILALSLLESMIKECGDVVHAYVAERDIPKKMVKIAKKKPDLRVKEKILFLVETWLEFFGGPLGMYPQYNAAYQELLNSGFLFPEKEVVSTALVVHPLYQQTLPFQSSPASEHTEYHKKESLAPGRSKDISRVLSLSDFKDARDVMDVLSEMLNDLGPGNKEGLNQEVIVNLVCKCRTNKERVVKLLDSTTDEYVISKAAALNDDLEKVLARYRVILAGPLVIEKPLMPPKRENGSRSVEQETSKQTNSSRSVPSTTKDDKLPPQQQALPDPYPGSTAMLSASAKVKEPLIDLLSGDDFSQPKSDENALEIVLYEPDHTASSQQVSSIADMFADLLSDDPNQNHGLTSYNHQKQTTVPVQSIVPVSSNLPDQHLSAETMPWHLEPTVHANGNLPALHLPKSISLHLEATSHANRCLPDQHLPKTVPFHTAPIVHTNRNSPDPVKPEIMSRHVEPTFYENGVNHSMAWTNYDPQINDASNQWNHTTGTSDHNEFLPPPPWESHASDISPFQDNQMGFQTTYPTQQPQSYPTQQHQLYPAQQHQFRDQQPQQILTGQQRSLQPIESTTNYPYSKMHNASFTNQQGMYTSQIDPFYDHNMYSYGYGYSYGSSDQENLSIYNSDWTTLVQQPNKSQNHWSRDAV